MKGFLTYNGLLCILFFSAYVPFETWIEVAVWQTLKGTVNEIIFSGQYNGQKNPTKLNRCLIIKVYVPVTSFSQKGNKGVKL